MNHLEELSLNAWPALQTKLYDGWILRFADGYTKRSNSINPIYPSSLPLDQKIECCENIYQSLNLPVVFKLTRESHPGDIDRELEKRGYSRIDETSVRLLELNRYAYRKPHGIRIECGFNEAWLNGFFICSGLDNPVQQKCAEAILNNILGQVIVAKKVLNNQIVACGYGAIERGYVGIFDIVVAKTHRGKGFGRDIMDGILSNAVDMGVKTAYLSVVVGNTPAENLYQSLGFEEIYRYWYRKK